MEVLLVSESEAGSGQMLLPVPAGSSHVEIEFGRTWDRTVGNVVSLVTILMCVPLMWWWGRRDAKPAQ